MRPVIFDVDGVLADFLSSYTALAKRLYGVPHLTTTTYRRWDEDGLTEPQRDYVWEQIIKSPSWWVNLAPLVGPDTFRRICLVNTLQPVYFVTSRPGFAVHTQTTAWLRNHGIFEPHVIVSSKKAEIASAVDAGWAIDDKAGNALAIAYMSPGTDIYLLDRLYNRFDHSVAGRRVTRVATVEEFLDRVEREGGAA